MGAGSGAAAAAQSGSAWSGEAQASRMACSLRAHAHIQRAESRDSDVVKPVFMEASFTILKRQEHPKFPSTDERINKMQPIPTLEYYSAIKRKKEVNREDGKLSDIARRKGQTLCDSSPRRAVEESDL